MAIADPSNPDEAIIDGLTNYAQLTGDTSVGQMGAMIYKSVADVVRTKGAPGESCSLAFPSMIIRPDIRTECLVVILDTKVVVAWKKGMIRKSIESETITKEHIKSAEASVSDSGATRGAALMTIQADRTVTFALAKGRPEVAAAIKEAILNPSAST